MVLTAQFSTLATVRTRLVNGYPSFIDIAWNGIALPAKLWNPPGVDNVIGSNQKFNFFTYWQHQWVVDFQQIVFNTVHVNTGVELSGCIRLGVNAGNNR